MNAGLRTVTFNSTFWLIAFVLLACVLSILLASKQTASQPIVMPSSQMPIVEQTPAKRLPTTDYGRKNETEQLAPQVLRTPGQLEKYKPNEL